MGKASFKKRVQELLEKADIVVNGDRPQDIKVHNEDLYQRVMAQGSLGLGESYMDGWWDCPRLDLFFFQLLRARVDDMVYNWRYALDFLKAKFFNAQRPSKAFEIGEHHYDMGNDLYRAMLDNRMIYSCAYWPGVATLDQAQEQKLDLICKKLMLEKGMEVLDIGCGWGGAAAFAAERYGVKVTGVTVSKEQVSLCRNMCQEVPVKIELKDYRDLKGKYDRIYSIGMFEHVGVKNYARFFDIVRNLLKKDGVFVLQTIGRNGSTNRTDPWITKYIFPNSMLPSPAQITESAEGRLVMEDWHAFGPDYDKTLMCWYEKFKNSWHVLKKKYNQRFFRMWEYYLLSCAGGFRSRRIRLFQIVFSKNGLLGGWRMSRRVGEASGEDAGCGQNALDLTESQNHDRVPTGDAVSQ